MLQELVGLLLVLDDDAGGADPPEGEAKLVGNGGGEEVQGNGTQGLGAQFAVEPLGAVVDDEGDRLAAADPQGSQAQGRLPDVGEIVVPGVGLPDAIGLFPDGRTVSQERRLVGEHLREGQSCQFPGRSFRGGTG